MYLESIDKTKDLKILVTCALGDYMKGTIKCFKENGERNITIVGVDMNEMTHNFVGLDKFYKVGRCLDKGYVDSILDIAIKEEVDVVIPFNTLELELFAERKIDFVSKGIQVMVSGGPFNLAIANNKDQAGAFMIANNIGTPETTIVDSYDKVKNVIDKHPGEVFCIKQFKGCGGRGFGVIGSAKTSALDKSNVPVLNEEDLEKMLSNGSQYLMQKYIKGKELTVDCLVDEGKVVYAITKENECMENGVARQSKIISCPEAEEECRKFCEMLGLQGNVGFDLMMDGNKPMIIDVNPRITATISLIHQAGVNLPYMSLKLLLKEEIDEDLPIKYGTSLHRRIEDYFFDEEGNQL